MLKRSLNLKARGFFLDNVQEINKLEAKEFMSMKEREDMLKLKKSDLASMHQ